MNIFIKILQVLLGLWTITGASYMIQNHESLITDWAMTSLPTAAWIVLGIIQILLGLGLLLSIWKRVEKLKTPSALGLAIISLLGIGVYTQYSGFPGLLWGVIPALILLFIAFKK